MSAQFLLPPIPLRTEYSKPRPLMKGPTVKFELRDEPTNANSGTHEKKIVQFHGEYGEDTPRFWCQFEAALMDVFNRKPCTAGPSRFGVTTSCLAGKALEDFNTAAAAVGGNQTLANFTSTLNRMKIQRLSFQRRTERYVSLRTLGS